MVNLLKIICKLWKHKWTKWEEKQIYNNFTGETITIGNRFCLRCEERERKVIRKLPKREPYIPVHDRRKSGRLQLPKRKVGLKPRTAFEKRLWKKGKKPEED